MGLSPAVDSPTAQHYPDHCCFGTATTITQAVVNLPLGCRKDGADISTPHDFQVIDASSNSEVSSRKIHSPVPMSSTRAHALSSPCYCAVSPGTPLSQGRSRDVLRLIHGYVAFVVVELGP